MLRNEKATPFEFIINGQFLRTSIDEYLTENGVSAENTLAVEYVRAIIPPLYLSSYEHDDWVGSVDVSPAASSSTKTTSEGDYQESGILSGGYDGVLRLWNLSSQVVASAKGLTGSISLPAIKTVKFMSRSQIASAGMDRVVRVWRLQQPEDGVASAELTARLELYGHKSTIESIATHGSSQRLLSGSHDHGIGFWSLKKTDAPEAPAALLPSSTSRGSKRRKVNPAVSVPQRGPLSLLKSHSAPVSSVIFAPHDHTFAYSASWDHSLKTWDLPTGTCVDTRTTSHSLLSLAALRSLSLVATGTSARYITLIDPRAGATTISAMTLRGHTNSVVALATDPESPYGLLSGSHDGTCRIWDVRSSRSDNEGRIGESVYCIERQSVTGRNRRIAGEGIKVFDVCWDRRVGILSAGEDKKIQINRGGDLTSAKAS